MFTEQKTVLHDAHEATIMAKSIYRNLVFLSKVFGRIGTIYQAVSRCYVADL